MKQIAATLMAVALLAGPAVAGEWLWTEPDLRNARGPGIHVDSFGRSYRDSVPDAWVFEPVTPNAYGLGVGSDSLGRPVRPTLTDPGEVVE